MIETENHVLSRGFASRRRKDVIETENRVLSRGSSVLDAKLRLDRYLSTDASSDASVDPSSDGTQSSTVLAELQPQSFYLFFVIN